MYSLYYYHPLVDKVATKIFTIFLMYNIQCLPFSFLAGFVCIMSMCHQRSLTLIVDAILTLIEFQDLVKIILDTRNAFSFMNLVTLISLMIRFAKF